MTPTIPSTQASGPGAEASGRPVRALVMMSCLQMGGGETNVVGFLPFLSRYGVEPALCTLTTARDTVLADVVARTGIARYDLGARRMLDRGAWRRLEQLVLDQRIDVIHSHDVDSNVVAALVRRRVGRAVVMTRNVLADETATWKLFMRSRLVFPAARFGSDHVITVADAVGRSFARRAALPRDHLTTIRTGIALERFTPAMTRDEAREALGWDTARPTVVMVSVLRQGKGHDLLFRAIPRLRASIPRVVVKIVGGGEMEEDLRRQAAHLGDAVEFTGQLYETLPTALWASDALVLPSRAEGLPIVLIEAAAAGLPVVATDVGGCSEVVAEGRTGFLVGRDDDEMLADRLAYLLQHGDAARAMGSAARSRAEARFSLSEQARATADLYRRVLAR